MDLPLNLRFLSEKFERGDALAGVGVPSRIAPKMLI